MSKDELLVDKSKEIKIDIKYWVALRAVMLLHEDYHYENGYLKTVSRCIHCETVWPCETMRVIQEELK